MTTQARLTCVEGTALRFPGAIPMSDGDSATVDVLLPATKEAPDAKSVIENAKDAPALGVDGVRDGIVSVMAIGGTLRVREYQEINPFSGSDDDYLDHIVRDGESVTAVTINSNAKTLVVMGPA